MKKYLILLISLMVPAMVQADQACRNNPIFCDIVKLKPTIDKKFAMTLANSIVKYSRKFGTDPSVSVAIAMQESSFENKNRMGSVIRNGRLMHGITDVGVFQIHVNTIANLKNEGEALDVRRLERDVDYQTFWHVKILKQKIRTCEMLRDKLSVVEGNEWSCYHSFTLAKRKVYLADVEAHLVKLAQF